MTKYLTFEKLFLLWTHPRQVHFRTGGFYHACENTPVRGLIALGPRHLPWIFRLRCARRIAGDRNSSGRGLGTPARGTSMSGIQKDVETTAAGGWLPSKMALSGKLQRPEAPSDSARRLEPRLPGGFGFQSNCTRIAPWSDSGRGSEA